MPMRHGFAEGLGPWSWRVSSSRAVPQLLLVGRRTGHYPSHGPIGIMSIAAKSPLHSMTGGKNVTPANINCANRDPCRQLTELSLPAESFAGAHRMWR
jgi:hypothetical protein